MPLRVDTLEGEPHEQPRAPPGLGRGAQTERELDRIATAHGVGELRELRGTLAGRRVDDEVISLGLHRPAHDHVGVAGERRIEHLTEHDHHRGTRVHIDEHGLELPHHDRRRAQCRSGRGRERLGDRRAGLDRIAPRSGSGRHDRVGHERANRVGVAVQGGCHAVRRRRHVGIRVGVGLIKIDALRDSGAGSDAVGGAGQEPAQIAVGPLRALRVVVHEPFEVLERTGDSLELRRRADPRTGRGLAAGFNLAQRGRQSFDLQLFGRAREIEQRASERADARERDHNHEHRAHGDGDPEQQQPASDRCRRAIGAVPEAPDGRGRDDAERDDAGNRGRGHGEHPRPYRAAHRTLSSAVAGPIAPAATAAAPNCRSRPQDTGKYRSAVCWIRRVARFRARSREVRSRNARNRPFG